MWIKNSNIPYNPNSRPGIWLLLPPRMDAKLIPPEKSNPPATFVHNPLGIFDLEASPPPPPSPPPTPQFGLPLLDPPPLLTHD